MVLCPKGIILKDPTSHIFKALGNQTRLKLLRLLNENSELSVSELTDELPREASTVSKHLTHLHMLNLVNVRQDAQNRIYSLNQDVLVGFLQDILDEFSSNGKT